MNTYYLNFDAIADSCANIANLAEFTPPAYISVFGKKSTAHSQIAIAATPSNSKKYFHTVRKGQTIAKVATQYGVAIADVRKWNKLRGTKLKAGQKLIVYKSQKERPPVAELVVAKKTIEKGKVKSSAKSKIHYVQQSDTLWNIAQKYEGVSVERIKKLNRLKSNELKIGQKLILG